MALYRVPKECFVVGLKEAHDGYITFEDLDFLVAGNPHATVPYTFKSAEEAAKMARRVTEAEIENPPWGEGTRRINPWTVYRLKLEEVRVIEVVDGIFFGKKTK